MIRRLIVGSLVAGSMVCPSQGYECQVNSPVVGLVTVTCPGKGDWSFRLQERIIEKGIGELEIEIASPTNAVPPAFSVSFDVPQSDAQHKWTGGFEQVKMPALWESQSDSRFCSWYPLVSFINDNDKNRILVAASEAARRVVFSAGHREEDCRIAWKVGFFSEPEAPIRTYSVKLRFDVRDVSFAKAIEEGTSWIEGASGVVAAHSPEAAFEPMYSTWYSFHQNVTDRAIEEECAEAAKLGMKAVIVDDGWQTDDNSRGYAYTGDWEISRSRFPDMVAHVKRVHDLGLKYMLWYGVPMVGIKSRNFERFRNKLLWVNYGNWYDYGCLDPRFPEVRRWLSDLYEQAVREWDIDGLKLDFVDAIAFKGEDPAVKDGYAGRDIRSLPEAINVLLRDVYERLTAIKPGFLFEFRQSYVGPCIRQYGNMLRAADCSGDLLANRCRTVNLRLTSGKTAVHSDMLEWDVGLGAEEAARYILSALFATIQYSVKLRSLPVEHRQMVQHWLGFSQTHRDALLKGSFRPHHFEAMYPCVESENSSERIVAVYTSSTVIDAGPADRDTYVINATGSETTALRLRKEPVSCEMFDTFGCPVPSPALHAGIQDVQIPVSGYLKIAY